MAPRCLTFPSTATPSKYFCSVALTRSVVSGGSVVVSVDDVGPMLVDDVPGVVASLGYCGHEDGREMEDAAAMVAGDPDIPRALIPHRFPIEDAAGRVIAFGGRAIGRAAEGEPWQVQEFSEE